MDRLIKIETDALSPAAQTLLAEVLAIRHQGYYFELQQVLLLTDTPESKVAVCLSQDQKIAALVADDPLRQRVFSEFYCMSQGTAYLMSSDYSAATARGNVEVISGAAPHQLMHSLYKRLTQTIGEPLQLDQFGSDLAAWFFPACNGGVILSGLMKAPPLATLGNRDIIENLRSGPAGELLEKFGLFSETGTINQEELIRRFGNVIDEQTASGDIDTNIVPFVRQVHRMLATRLGMTDVAAKPDKPAPPQPDSIVGSTHPSRRFAWVPKSKPGDGALTASKFGGTPWLAADEAWPCCEICGKAMQLFVQVNFAELLDPAGHPIANGLLQMFHCVSDAECELDDGWEPFPAKAMKQVRIVYPEEHEGKALPLPSFDYGVPLRQVVAWERVADFPARPEDDADEFTVRRHVLYDKVFGWPSWVQYPEYPDCPVCGNRMRFLMQVGDAANLDYMWGDAGSAYLFDCPEHPEQATMLWQCH